MLALWCVGVAGSIIGGYGDYKFSYDPTKLLLPEGTHLLNAHGFVLDPTDDSILLTYEPVHNSSDKHCLIKWMADGSGGETIGPGASLCAGTPHGLRLSLEDDNLYLCTPHMPFARACREPPLTAPRSIRGRPRE